MASVSTIANTVTNAITASAGNNQNPYLVPVGDFYTDSRLQNYIRPQVIEIMAYGMRPQSQLYVYFASQRVDIPFCAPAALNPDGSASLVQTGTYGSPLYSNADGSFYAIFCVPQGIFLTGQSQLMLSDSNYIDAINTETTTATANFNSFNENTIAVAAPSPNPQLIPTANTSVSSQIVNLLGVSSIVIEYNTTVYNPDVLAVAKTLGWNGKSTVHITVIVDTTGVIGSTSTSIPSLLIPVTPLGSTITIINNGYIVGAGGDGGDPGRGNLPGAAWLYGQPGGAAIYTDSVLTINNKGVIAGGGGGGGAGGWNDQLTGGAGGGGAGSRPGHGGGPNRVGLTSGGDGTLLSGGGTGSYDSVPGGSGGALGGVGSSGTSASFSGYAGGAAGSAIIGYAKASISGPGKVLGPVVN